MATGVNNFIIIKRKLKYLYNTFSNFVSPTSELSVDYDDERQLFRCFTLFYLIGLYDGSAELFSKTAIEALRKKSNKDCGCKRTLPDTFQTMQIVKRKRGCHSDERYIKNDFHVTKFHACHMADRKYDPFARQSNYACRNFKAHPKCNHNNTDCTNDPLLPIKVNLYSVYTPNCKVRKISENKRDRKLN